jgi:hypothetical protein
MRTDFPIARPFERTASRAGTAPRWILTVVLILSAVFAFAQTGDKFRARGSGFRAVLEYHEPPHETQIKSLLEGDEADHRPGGLVEINRLKLQTFTEAGTPEWVIEAPHCIFNISARTVHSPGTLGVRSADSGLSFSGRGFLWQQSGLLLTISNDIQTHVRGSLTNSLIQ